MIVWTAGRASEHFQVLPAVRKSHISSQKAAT
jgi:hypothetical protein